VLFRDLPYKLTITSTMINGDIPDSIKKQLQVGPDGQVIFSTDTTPNMDVAAAMCCSSAVPGFFNAPQLQLMQECDRTGDPILHRMQMVDGGVTNNFPMTEGSDEKRDGKAFLVDLPVYCQAPSLTAGAPPVSLSTLNFDSTNLPAINAFNHANMEKIGPALAKTIHQVADSGYQRVLIGIDLADTAQDQTAPVLQGNSRAETNQILQVADQNGLAHLDANAGAAHITGNLQSKKPTLVEQLGLNALLGKDHTFHPGILHQPSYTPPTQEARGISDMLASVLGAYMTAPSQLAKRQFEKT
jgi:hypothetical protein